MLSYPEDERALEAAIDSFAAFGVAQTETDGVLTESWAETLAVLRPALEAAGTAAHQFLELITPVCRVAYEAAGQPYGADDAGLWHWLTDQVDTTRLVQEAEAQIAWDGTLALLGRHVREHQAGDAPACPHCRTVHWNRKRVGRG